jgi:uncharacterized protein YaiL (DUF2058 family)
MSSLQEQLLKAGMVDEKKAKKLKKEQRKQAKQTPKGKVQVNEAQELAKQTQSEKSARDRELNLQRQQSANEKAIAAQVRQLVTTNLIDRNGGEIAYQFTDGKKIKKIYITALLQKQLSVGLIAIVKLDEHYELVPAAVAEKISQRADDVVLLKNQTDKNLIAADDPYADYQIPDDLMW